MDWMRRHPARPREPARDHAWWAVDRVPAIRPHPFGGVIVAAAAGIWTWRFDPAVAAGTAVVPFAGTVMFLNSIIES
ncbi:hypothetical protein [Streptomyces sp. KS 21]|uniref:hypothetical protein n=1 Tax=Streptomyces sp. KS 21 TaxID=2485150 RepID=UPI00106429EE|nr:hypothetical protein [Streptomyces sp. KS 21]